MAEQLPAAVRDLITRYIASMDHVELLVLLAESESEPEAWTVGRIADRIHSTVSDTTTRLTELESFDMISRVPSPGGTTYKYAPTPALRAAITELIAMYHQRPVTLVRAIYARPASPLVSFANAFRLKPPLE